MLCCIICLIVIVYDVRTAYTQTHTSARWPNNGDNIHVCAVAVCVCLYLGACAYLQWNHSQSMNENKRENGTDRRAECCVCAVQFSYLHRSTRKCLCLIHYTFRRVLKIDATLCCLLSNNSHRLLIASDCYYSSVLMTTTNKNKTKNRFYLFDSSIWEEIEWN